MSDLIARLDHAVSLRHVSLRLELFAEAAAALRQKDSEIAAGKASFTALDEICTEALRRAKELEAQISALRDQQPVAWACWTKSALRLVEQEPGLTANTLLNSGWDRVQPLYAHPSCVSPDKPQQEKRVLVADGDECRKCHSRLWPCDCEKQQGNPSGVASDQSKRGADSNESADHPVE